MSTYQLPPTGENPSTLKQGTTPGSFANKGRVGTPWTFSSPDTPGMPQPSDKTAWDFLPNDWSLSSDAASEQSEEADRAEVSFTDSTGTIRTVFFPKTFRPITQLEHARLGIITDQMKRVSEREPHL